MGDYGPRDLRDHGDCNVPSIPSCSECGKRYKGFIYNGYQGYDPVCPCGIKRMNEAYLRAEMEKKAQKNFWEEYKKKEKEEREKKKEDKVNSFLKDHIIDCRRCHNPDNLIEKIDYCGRVFCVCGALMLEGLDYIKA